MYADQWGEVLDSQEVAQFLKLAPKTVREYAKKKIIPARKIGSQWRFSKREIEKWLRGEYCDSAESKLENATESEKIKCSENVVQPIKSTYTSMDCEYANLLGLPTDKKPKSIMTS